MDSFELFDGYQNLPGLVQVEFCPVEGVNDIPEAITGSVSGNITLAAGYSWLTGEFLIRTSNYGEVCKGAHRVSLMLWRCRVSTRN